MLTGRGGNLLFNIEVKNMPSYLSFLSCIIFFCSGLWANQSDPAKFVEKGIVQLMEVLKNNPESEARYSGTLEMYQKNFDLPRLAGMTLGGTKWKSLSTEDKIKFTQKYGEFVHRFYLSKMKGLGETPFSIGEAQLKSRNTRAIVPVKVPYEGKEAVIRYSCIYKNEKWRIYDVEIAGVRLSTTYRNQFSKLIVKGDVEPLLKELQTLIDKAKANS